MGQTWDGGDIARDPATWAIIRQALRPGGFLVAFGGTRTYHRMACAIEDAGFVIQDCLMWLYATGFPKRRDMLKPAYEPIVLAYKPGGKRTMQVDECRIACDDKTPFPVGATSGRFIDIASSKPRTEDTAINGRWPANICHDGSDEVVACFPESAGAQGIVKGNEARTRLVMFTARSNGSHQRNRAATPAQPPASSSPQRQAPKTAGAAGTQR